MPLFPGSISSNTVETVAGLSAGFLSTVIAHPLDIIKTRMQLDTSAHPLLNSSRSVLQDILRNEGPTRLAALYRGLTPNVVGNASGWALYFLWYKQAQDLVRSTRGYADGQQMTSLDYICASAGAGAASAALTNPIWVIKTRMISTSSATEGAYPSMLSGLVSIYRLEGWRGYFHGLTPALFGVSHSALYFLAYENLKKRRRQQYGRVDAELTNTDTIGITALSKVFAGSATYPSQVIRARLQRYDPSAKVVTATPSMLTVIKNLWRNEGVRGFYKGLLPNLVRVVPSTCVMFLAYENTRWVLPRLFDGNQEKEMKMVVE